MTGRSLRWGKVGIGLYCTKHNEDLRITVRDCPDYVCDKSRVRMVNGRFAGKHSKTGISFRICFQYCSSCIYSCNSKDVVR